LVDVIVHGLKICGVSFYYCFEVAPLFEKQLVLGRVGCVVLVYELIKLAVEMLDLLSGWLVDFIAPLHQN